MPSEVKAQDTTSLASIKTVNEAATQSRTLLAEMQDAAQAAGTTLEGIYQDAKDAQTAADTAQMSADSALVNLATIEDVVGVLNWITEHGTMTSQSGGTFVDGQVYFVLDPYGDYVIQNVHYSVVSEPVPEDIDDYYVLTVDESVQNYVATHIVVDSEGLWIIPDAGGNKVLIATGSGTTYTTAGTYIVGRVNNLDTVFAKFTAGLAQIGEDGNKRVVVNTEGLTLYSEYEGANFLVLSNGSYHEEDVLYVSHNFRYGTYEGSWNSGTSGYVDVAARDIWDQGSVLGHFVKIKWEMRWGGTIWQPKRKDYGTAILPITNGRYAVSLPVNKLTITTPATLTDDLRVSWNTTSDLSNMGTFTPHVYIKAVELMNEETVQVPDPTLAFGFQSASAERGSYSSSFGMGVNAVGDYQTAVGKYNIEDTNDEFAFIVGNGTYDGDRSNALTVDWDGTINSYSNEYERDTGGSANDGIQFCDKNGDVLAYVKAYCESDGQGGYNEGFNAGTSRVVGGSTKWNTLRLQIKEDGSPLVTIGQPEAWRTALGLALKTYDYSQFGYESGFTYYATTSTSAPKAVKCGNVVTLGGAIKPTAAQSSTGQKVMGYVPTDCKPAQDVMFLQQGSGVARYQLFIRASDGALIADRYGTTADTPIPNGVWLNISATYISAV